ncbi:MAG: enoyl-CoA hydratase [Clostridia bacterium]|jgi:enoyl-CoA hydratase|nr:enoyl-CoA hydratase [Clostridia bacterium]MDN5323132.1 enoyl-CoA hydratase [Clostridia bacterium]
MLELQNVLMELEEGILTITINRPKVLNALNTDTLLDIQRAIKEARENEEVKAVIITGAGEKAFVAGADIAQMKELDVLTGRKMTMLGQDVFNEIENLDKPVIAAVNGFALGGGCEIAMACDIRIASEKAKFGQPEVNLGIIPGYGGTQRLPRLIGKGRAKYYIFTGEMMTAQQAFQFGLADKVVAPEELISTAREVAKTIMAKAPVAVMMAKRAINNGLDMDLDSGIAYEAEAYTTTFGTQDRVEGMTAFVEKRKANFIGK